ncbi:hypothetical protein ACQEU6_06805 [Spirillospora sp. CA-108201]
MALDTSGGDRFGPMFQLFTEIPWLGTFPALILPDLSFALPLTIWILTGFFAAMPWDLEKAAVPFRVSAETLRAPPHRASAWWAAGYRWTTPGSGSMVIESRLTLPSSFAP